MENNELLKQIKDVSKDRELLYQLLENLGITYKKTNCKKCLRDYFAIAREELGLIENAADESDFNGEWKYLPNRTMTWKGYLINQSTDPKIIEEFVKKFPTGYYKRVSR